MYSNESNNNNNNSPYMVKKVETLKFSKSKKNLSPRAKKIISP